MKPAKILYFVNGPAPSPEDFQAAGALNATVVFRNACAVSGGETCLEICDGVAGQVPLVYAEKYPKAEDAISKKAEELEALTSKVGDSKPIKQEEVKKAEKEGDEGQQEPPVKPVKPVKPAVWNPNQ